jgi:RNA polymerase sigma-70 factor, ECF subfamily
MTDKIGRPWSRLVTDPSVPRHWNHNPSTSLSLIQQALADDRDAWERIVLLYSPLVDRWCRRRLSNEEAIRDVGQDVLMTVYAKLDQFKRDEPGHSFRKWLKTITMNRINDLYRKWLISPPAPGGSDAMGWFSNQPVTVPLEDLETEKAEDEAERQMVLRRCLELVRAEFEPRTFDAFWMVVVEDMSPEAVADALSMKSVGSVYTAKARVTKRLRGLLNQLEETLPGL